MKYSVKLNGKQYDVEVEKISDDFRAMTRAEINGEVAATPGTAAAAGAASTPAAVSSSTAAVPASAVPAAASVSAAPASTTSGAASSAGASEASVLSPMPGTVLEVKAAAGQTVRAGDTLVVIEAMKMENEIVAPRDGVVASIPVKKGDSIDTDAVLAVLA